MGQTNTKAGVFAWGSSESGQLGIGLPLTETKPYPPTLIDNLRTISIQAIACNGHHGAAVSSSGDLYTWGMGKDGQLGHGDALDKTLPKLVKSLQGKTVRGISCGENHTAACLDDGTVYTWGRSANGRLGIEEVKSHQRVPTLVRALSGTFISAVSCGGFHTLFLTASPLSSVYSCGLGLSGRLGHGNEMEHRLPTLIPTLEGLSCITICAGTHHSACITQSGHLYMWGGSAFGKLGLGHTAAQLEPKRVGGLLIYRTITDISLGNQHSVCVTSTGDIYSWGQGGRLGHSPQGECDEYYPKQIVTLAGLFVLQVSCGHSHTVAVLETGDVWAWGGNRILGHNEADVSPNIPTRVRSLVNSGVHHVCCGESFTMALCNDKFVTEKAASATTALQQFEASASQVKQSSFASSSSMTPPKISYSEEGNVSSLEVPVASTFPSTHPEKASFFEAFTKPQPWPLHFEASHFPALSSKGKSSTAWPPMGTPPPPSKAKFLPSEPKHATASRVHTPSLLSMDALPSTSHLSMTSFKEGDPPPPSDFIDNPPSSGVESPVKEETSAGLSVTATLHTLFHPFDQNENFVGYYKELAFLNARLRLYEQQQSVLTAALQKATHDLENEKKEKLRLQAQLEELQCIHLSRNFVNYDVPSEINNLPKEVASSTLP